MGRRFQEYGCGGGCKEGLPLEHPRLSPQRLSAHLVSLAVPSADLSFKH